MEALIHNLNTMNSRAGAQVPFSSINYGMDTSPEGRMVVRNILLATEAGLGNGETPIFPIQIFRVKEGVSFTPRSELRSVPPGHPHQRQAAVPQLQLSGRAL
jgi:ribonucleoside-triphosphate reductase